MRFETVFEQDPVVQFLRSPHDHEYLTQSELAQEYAFGDTMRTSLARRVVGADVHEIANDQKLYEQTIDDAHIMLRSLARMYDSGIYHNPDLGFGFQILQGTGPIANRATSLYVNEHDAVIVQLEESNPRSILTAILDKREGEARPQSTVQAELWGENKIQALHAHAGWRVTYGGDLTKQRAATFDGLQVAVGGLIAAYNGEDWPDTPTTYLDRHQDLQTVWG